MPPTESGHLRTWVGVGGTPASVVRAARYGMPVVIAIIGGSPAGFEPLAGLYRRACAEHGHQGLPIAVHSPGHVASTDEQAAQEYLPHFVEQMRKLGAERGWPPMSEAAARQQFGPDGAVRSEEHTSELQSRENLVCRLLLEKKKHRSHHRITTRT